MTVPQTVRTYGGALLQRRAGSTTLLILCALAWWATLGRARGMDPMSPSMGLGLPEFVAMWAMMMVAMMLPSVSPIAMRYARMITRRRAVRLTGFVTGYLAVWAVSALPAFALMAGLDRAAQAGPLAAKVTLSTVLGACGLYQLSPWKRRCLRLCRAPMSVLLRYASWRGAWHELRVGVHHGGACLGCCWALMALMVGLGAMSLVLMVALTGVVAAEKLAPGGQRFTRASAIVALIFAGALWWFPELIPGMYLQDM